MNRIVLTVHRRPKIDDDYKGRIRINREAEAIIKELQIATGLPLSRIASQIIIQAADQVEIVEV